MTSTPVPAQGAETPEQAAVREIMEETGITGRVLRHLATIDYWFAGHEHRVHKVVHHFLLEAVSGTTVSAAAAMTRLMFMCRSL